MVKKLQAAVEQGVHYFRYVYLAFLVLSFLNFSSQRVEVAAYLITAAALVLIASDLLLTKRLLHSKNSIFLGLALVLYIISSAVNYQYGVLDNIKGFLWFLMQVALIYAYNKNLSRDEYKREAQIVMTIFCILIAAASFASIVMYYCQYGSIFIGPRGKQIVRGVEVGRLWGEYTDPNYGAMIALLCLFFSIYKFTGQQSKLIRCLYGINIVIQITYIALSDSRTALVSSVIAFGILTGLLSYRRFCLRKPNKWLYRWGLTFLASLLSMICTLFVVKGVQFIYMETVAESQENSAQALMKPLKTGQVFADSKKIMQVQTISAEGADVSEDDGKKNFFGIGRDFDLEGDISDGRFQLWKEGMILLSRSPIFGTSPRNLHAVAEATLPDSYMIRYSFQALHNGYLDVLVCLGITGFLTLLLFGIRSAYLIFTRWKLINGQDYTYIAILFSALCSICCSACFLTEIFLINSVGAFFFWLLLGYLIHYFETRQVESVEAQEPNHR